MENCISNFLKRQEKSRNPGKGASWCKLEKNQGNFFLDKPAKTGKLATWSCYKKTEGHKNRNCRNCSLLQSYHK